MDTKNRSIYTKTILPNHKTIKILFKSIDLIVLFIRLSCNIQFTISEFRQKYRFMWFFSIKTAFFYISLRKLFKFSNSHINRFLIGSLSTRHKIQIIANVSPQCAFEILQSFADNKCTVYIIINIEQMKNYKKNISLI